MIRLFFEIYCAHLDHLGDDQGGIDELYCSMLSLFQQELHLPQHLSE